MLTFLLHTPSMLKAEVALLSAFACLVLLCIQLAIVYRFKHRDIYHPDVFVREMYAPEDVEEIVLDGAFAMPSPLNEPKPWTRFRAYSAAFGLIAAVFGGWIGLHNLLIIRCWDSAEQMISRKDFAGAEIPYRRAISVDPVIGKSHLLLAQALLKQSRILTALPELYSAMKYDKTNASTFVLHGDCMMHLRRPDMAEPDFRQAIAITPKSAEAYIKLGQCLIGLSRVENAESEFRFATQLDPKSVKAQANLGNLQFARGKNAEGIEHLRRAVELAPTDVIAHDALACAYAKDGQLDRAVTEFRSELALDPEFAIGYYNLGATLQQIHDKGGAVAAYQTYLRKSLKNPKISGGLPSAIEMIDKLNASTR